MTIVPILLAVPASAFAFTGTTGSDTDHPATLPVQVTPKHVRLGRPVTVSGYVVGAQGARTVELQSAPDGSGGGWRRVASTRTSSAGRYTFHVHLHRSGALRAVEVGAPTAPRAHAATAATGSSSRAPRVTAISRAAPIEVQARLRVPGRDRDVVAGHTVPVSGQLLPGRAGRTVAVQAPGAQGWRTLARGRTGAHGGFAVRVRATSAGERHLRVLFAGDRENARATTGAGGLELMQPVVASWYDDAASTGCGFHATDGVANKTLPCGTKVRFAYHGRTVTATVDDRGPYVSGREYDLNQNTAAALGFGGVGTVYASVQ